MACAATNSQFHISAITSVVFNFSLLLLLLLNLVSFVFRYMTKCRYHDGLYLWGAVLMAVATITILTL